MYLLLPLLPSLLLQAFPFHVAACESALAFRSKRTCHSRRRGTLAPPLDLGSLPPPPPPSPCPRIHPLHL